MQSESSTSQTQRIPWLMAGARAVLGPAMVLGERAGWSGTHAGGDGRQPHCSPTSSTVSSRAAGSATPPQFDSSTRWPTSSSMLGCAVALWMRHPASCAVSLRRSQRSLGLKRCALPSPSSSSASCPSYHSYLAKTWGLVLASALVAAFVSEASRELAGRRARAGRTVESRRIDDVADHAGVAAGCEDACSGMAAARNRTARQRRDSSRRSQVQPLSCLRSRQLLFR